MTFSINSTDQWLYISMDIDLKLRMISGVETLSLEEKRVSCVNSGMVTGTIVLLAAPMDGRALQAASRIRLSQ